jgi:hypothetical protein
LAGSVVRLGGEISDYKVIERYPLEASEAYGVLAALGREECKNVEIVVPAENRPGIFAWVTILIGNTTSTLQTSKCTPPAPKVPRTSLP